MAKEQTELPKAIVMPNGDRYIPCLFKVLSRDEENRIEECVHLPAERVVELVGGEEFFSAYVFEKVVKK